MLIVVIQAHDEMMTCGFYEIRDMLIDLGFKGKSDRDNGRVIHVKDCACSQSINRHICNFNDIP